MCVVISSSLSFFFRFPRYLSKDVALILNCRKGKTFGFTSLGVLAFEQFKHLVLRSHTRVNGTSDCRSLTSSTLKPCLRGVSCSFFPSFLVVPFVIFAAQPPNYCLHWLFDTQGPSVHCGTMLSMHLAVRDHCKSGADCWLSWRSWFQIRSRLQIQQNDWEHFHDCCR